MWTSKETSLLERLVYSVSRVLNWIGAWALAGLVLLMTMSSLWRYVFRAPIGGSVELIEILMSFTVFLGLGYAMAQKSHITFDLVVSRLPRRTQAVIHSIMCFLGMALFGLMSWRTAVQGIRVWGEGEITGDLPIPLGPFILVAASGMAVLCLVLLVQFIYSLSGRKD